MTKTKTKIIDANGYLWKWDGNRVYMDLAEKEMKANGEDTTQNGYPASTLEDALKVLADGGYMQ